MYRIVRRLRISPFDRANELLAIGVGGAGLVALVFVAILSGFALYR